MTEFIKSKFNKNNENKKNINDKFIDEELKDRGKLVRIICLVAVAVLLLGIIGTISIVNITYEGDDKKTDAIDMSALGTGDNEETIAQLEEVQRYLDYIGSSVDDSTLTLNTLYEDNERMKAENGETKELNTEINNGISSLTDKMKGMDKEIESVRSEITSLITELKESEGSSHTEYKDRLDKLGGRVSDLSGELSNYISDISSLIKKVEGDQKSDYDSLTAALNNMKSKLSADNESSLKSLTELLDGMSQNMNGSLSDMNSSINNRFNDMENNFYTTINGDSGLRAFINEKLESVFTLVADGKKMLAAALATKNMEVAEDAAFSEIKDAILGIPQELVIGVERLPGEIEYTYHYHVDANGERTYNTTYLTTQGGCFTVGGHIHNSGCATRTYYSGNGHYNNSTQDRCWCGKGIDHSGGTGSCPDYAQVAHTEYACGNMPVNVYYKGCGLVDEQIIGAVIKYKDYDTLPANSVYYTSSAGSPGTVGTSSVSGGSSNLSTLSALSVSSALAMPQIPVLDVADDDSDGDKNDNMDGQDGTAGAGTDSNSGTGADGGINSDINDATDNGVSSNGADGENGGTGSATTGAGSVTNDTGSTNTGTDTDETNKDSTENDGITNVIQNDTDPANSTDASNTSADAGENTGN